MTCTGDGSGAYWKYGPEMQQKIDCFAADVAVDAMLICLQESWVIWMQCFQLPDLAVQKLGGLVSWRWIVGGEVCS